MTGHYNQISLGSASRELINLRYSCSERLLHEHVFACVERILGEGEVAGGGCRDHYAINAGIFKNRLMRLNRAAERKICLHKGAPFHARIHDVFHAAPGQSREVTQKIRAPVATSDLGQD